MQKSTKRCHGIENFIYLILWYATKSPEVQDPANVEGEEETQTPSEENPGESG